MAISALLAASLDNLKATITQAESRLARMPGVGKARVDIDSSEEDGTYRFLSFSRENRELVVVTMNGPSEVEYTRLSELSVDDRIRCAELIPEFIENALAQQDDLTSRVDDAASEIQQALASLD